MPEGITVLEREATSSGTAASASLASRYLMRHANELRPYMDFVSYSTAARPRVGVNAFSAGVPKLLQEEMCAACRGTIASSNAFRQFPLNSVVYALLKTGFADTTQYLLSFERRNEPKTPRTSGDVLDAKELTRRALVLSGLTRDQLAAAMGVRRQSVQNWLGSHGGISPDNQERLRDLVSLFERARRKLGSSRHVSNWLTTPVGENKQSPLELLTVSGIDAVKGHLLRGSPVRGASIISVQASRRIPRRTGHVGQRPPWTQPSRAQEFDPEEDGTSTWIDGVDEPYRDVRPSRVTGLARA